MDIGERLASLDDAPLASWLSVLDPLRFIWANAAAARLFSAAGDGERALALVGQRPDVLVIDVGLPGMSGAQVRDAFVERYPGLPVLFVSGYTEEAVLRRGVTRAREALLQKPFTLEALSLQLSRLRRERRRSGARGPGVPSA